MFKKALSCAVALAISLGGLSALPFEVGTYATASSADITIIYPDKKFENFEYILYDDQTIELWYDQKATVENVVIPNEIDGNRVTKLGQGCFAHNECIKNVTLPDGLESLGMGSFAGTKISSIIIPDSVKAVGEFAFDSCKNLSYVRLNDGLIGLGEGCFARTNLKEIIIPNSVTGIYYGAFADCINLKNVTIPKKVSYIGQYAFGYCDSENNKYSKKIPNFKIFCYSGTEGEEYAKENGFEYELLDTPKAKTNLSKLTATADKTVFGYTGKAKAPTVTIKDGSYTLKQGTDYTLSYKNNKNIGTGTITVTGKGDYTGTKNLSFTIIPSNVGGFKAAATLASAVKLSWNKVSGAQGYIVYQYNTSTKKWVRIAKTGNVNTYTVKSLKAGTTYKYAVKAYKTVSGKDYTSAKYPTITTSTKPAKVSFKATAASKAVKFSWSKVTGATNYIVYYRVKGTSSWKSVKVANSVTSKTISGLVKGKTYEVTVKAVRTVNKVNYNGAYDAKTVKVK